MGNKIYLFDDKMVITCNYKDEDIDISLEDIENSGILGDITNNGENAKTLDNINENTIKKSIKKLPEHKCSDNSQFGELKVLIIEPELNGILPKQKVNSTPLNVLISVIFNLKI